MLHNNKTWDNSNLRDVQKTFNDGLVYVYKAKERTLIEEKGYFHFSNETVGVKTSFDNYINKDVIEKAIGIPKMDGIVPQDIVKIDNVFYKVMKTQRKDNKKPNFLKVFLKEEKIKYEFN